MEIKQNRNMNLYVLTNKVMLENNIVYQVKFNDRNAKIAEAN